MVELALAARGRTDGRFDPTVHDAVVSAGYDRSFEHVPEEGTAVIVGSVCGGAVRIDGTRIELDEGVRLDLGGIGKGYAANACCRAAVGGRTRARQRRRRHRGQGWLAGRSGSRRPRAS